MKSQAEAFYALVKNQDPARLEDVWREANIFEWRESHLPIVLNADVAAILRRYISGELTATQVEDWAEFLEAARYELGSIGDAAVIQAIERLANQRLNGPLTRNDAENILQAVSL